MSLFCAELATAVKTSLRLHRQPSWYQRRQTLLPASMSMLFLKRLLQTLKAVEARSRCYWKKDWW